MAATTRPVHLNQVKEQAKPQAHPVGMWTLFGLWICIALGAYISGGFSLLLADFNNLLHGNLALVKSEPDFLGSFLAAIALQIPLVMLVFIASNITVPNKGTHAVTRMMQQMTPGNHFRLFFWAVVVEEFCARFLFLGALTYVQHWNNPIIFWILVLVGNLGFALVHLFNYAELEDRKVIKVLPQFIIGLFFTLVFVHFGFFAAVITHLGFNCTLMAANKQEKIPISNLYIALWEGICAIGAFLLMSKPLTDISVWLNSSQYQIPGWGFWDYTLVAIFLSSMLGLIVHLLAFDDSRDDEQPTSNRGPVKVWVDGIVGMGMIFGLYFLLGLIIDPALPRICLLAITLAGAGKTKTPSQVSRQFWVWLPTYFLLLFMVAVLGWWQGILFAAIAAALSLPNYFLMYKFPSRN